jgi:hypothetical protein
MAKSNELVEGWSSYDLWNLNQRWESEHIQWSNVHKVYPVGSTQGVLGAIRNRVLNYPFKESATGSGRPHRLPRTAPVKANPRTVQSTSNTVEPNAALIAPAKVFIAYPRVDKRYRNALVKHLSPLKRQGIVDVWYDGEIVAGQEWEAEIIEHLEAANIILMLISADFIASDYCYEKELKRAKERHQRGEATVIPIMVNWVHHTGEWFATLQMLPENSRPVTDWSPQDKAWTDVAEGIRRAIEKQLAKF